MRVLRETGIIFARQMRPTLRNPAVLIGSLTMPVLFLALFGPLLGDLPGALGSDSWQWFVPGILVMVAMTAFFAGFSWLPEMRSGSHERLLATPVSRVALLLGRVSREVVVLLVQAVLIIAIMIPFGLRVSAGMIGLSLPILLVLGAGVSALSYVMAMAVRDEYAFSGVVNSIFMPLMLLSGMFLPMALAPAWLSTLSQVNPFTHVVDAQRALFAGNLTDPSVPLGAALALAIAVAALAWGARAMRRLST